MYTENANVEKEYYNDDEDYSSNDNRRGIIIKVIIIAVCVIILILLILALKKSRNNNVVYDPKIHNDNIQEVRLAAEKYYFIDGNMPKSGLKTVSLQTLKNKGLINDIVDANKKVCNNTNSTTSLTNDSTAYILKIKLSCSTEENEEVFYYDKKNLACLNCNGKTLMDGKTKEEEVKPINNDNIYSCSTWSKWTNKKENDLSLIERVRKLYLGVKEGKEVEKITYSEWSEYYKTPIALTNTMEVETKQVVEGVWSETKQTKKYVANSDTIKVISTSSTSGGSYTYCPSGYEKKDGKCVSKSTQRGDLTYLQYFSGDYIIHNKPCDKISTVPDDNGHHKVVYRNCLYNTTTSMKKGYSSGSTIYYYQELISMPVTYYRYRNKVVEKVMEDNVYTKEYYEEKNMPSGYKIVPNSEKLEYSYKLKECEK